MYLSVVKRDHMFKSTFAQCTVFQIFRLSSADKLLILLDILLDRFLAIYWRMVWRNVDL